MERPRAEEPWLQGRGQWQPLSQAPPAPAAALPVGAGGFSSHHASPHHASLPLHHAHDGGGSVASEEHRGCGSARIAHGWQHAPVAQQPHRHQFSAAASVGSGSSDEQLGALGGRPSQHLRQLLNTVASSEAWLEILQEQNYQLRVRCLQQMRGAVLLSTMRGPFLEWSNLCAQSRRQMMLEDLRAKLLGRCIPLVTRDSCAGRKPLLRNVLRSWRRALWGIIEENRMLDELEAHRKGRGQVIQQYRGLEAALDSERRLNEELRAQCQESNARCESMKEELAWATSRLEGQAQEAEEQSSKARLLNDQLRDAQDRAADLKRELRAQAEKTRRLELQARQDEDERRELHDALSRAERAGEASRGGLQLAREQETSRSEAALRQRDGRIAALEAQLLEARGCLEALSRGASSFLVRGGQAPSSCASTAASSLCGGGPPGAAATRSSAHSSAAAPSGGGPPSWGGPPSCGSARSHHNVVSPAESGFSRVGMESLLHFSRSDDLRASLVR